MRVKYFWNYIFFSTWKVLIAFSKRCIEMPIDYFISMIPYYRNYKNREEIKKINNYIMDGKEAGIYISYAYYIMLMTTSIFWGGCSFYIIYFLNLDFGNKIVFYLIMFFVCFLSYMLNEYSILWNKNGYLKFFKEFEKTRNKKIEMFTFFIFHFGMLGFAILSVYFTIFSK